VDRSVGSGLVKMRRRAQNARHKLNREYQWERPHRQILAAVTEDHGYTVQAGPFMGMHYDPGFPTDQALVPRLLGYYEAELHPIIHQAIAKGYDRIIDIGSSEGYYAVGFARRLPEAQVFAFDIDEEMQARCRQMTELNGVKDRVHIRGLCDHSALEEHVTERSLIISDCEGGEMNLLDPSQAPSLLKADLIVEVHDHIVPGISKEMIARFQPTHDIGIVASMLQDPRRFECLQSLSSKTQRLAVDERRPVPMEWMVMTRRL